MEVQQSRDKEETFIQTGRRGREGHRQAAPEERTPGKVMAGRPSEVADCGTWQARLQLADPTAPHSCVDKPGGTVGQ